MGPQPKCNEIVLAGETKPSALRVTFLSNFRALGTANCYPLLLTLSEQQRRSEASPSECEARDVNF
jgi:hypothetical protein